MEPATLRTIRLLLVALLITGCSTGDWRTASRESARIAPDPATTPEAVIQVYGAPTWGWRGWVALHTWIAMKPAGAAHYTVYEVSGWRERRSCTSRPVSTASPAP